MRARASLARLATATLALALASACGGEGAGESGETGSAAGYAFASDDPASYARVDRIGMPAVGTAVIADRQAYNEGNPADDADFVPEISASVEALHAALDDDITGAGLQPCAPADCLTQAAPFVVPDTISIDLDATSGFPNGRALRDPVIDVTLALLLLDLGAGGQGVTSLVGVLNPSENDLPFAAEFPYLAPAHTL